MRLQPSPRFIEVYSRVRAADRSLHRRVNQFLQRLAAVDPKKITLETMAESPNHSRIKVSPTLDLVVQPAVDGQGAFWILSDLFDHEAPATLRHL